MGICTADINGDGWIDFLLTNFGEDLLHINQAGEGFLVKPLEKAASNNQWSTSCAFGDLDGDLDLDLYVSRYVDYQMNGNDNCKTINGKGYCNPKVYPGQKDGLYTNDGNGNFTDVSSSVGIHTGTKDRGFGVIINDLDGDKDLDIYVANDGSQNRLYLNNGQGHFIDHGLLSGSALNQNGQAEAGMGIAVADVNNDLSPDLIVSHYAFESNTLYLNNNGLFVDSTQQYKISKNSYHMVGWGIELKDFNLDGYDDLVVANGYFDHQLNEQQALLSYAQKNQLFINHKGQHFNLQAHDKIFSDHDLSSSLKSSRGLATFDWNNDGKLDIVINNVNDDFQLYSNTHLSDHNWIGFQLIGHKNNTSAIGSQITINQKGIIQSKGVTSGTSFMSQSDSRIVFGLGLVAQPISVKVLWPDGVQKLYQFSDLNRYNVIRYPN